MICLCTQAEREVLLRSADVTNLRYTLFALSRTRDDGCTGRARSTVMSCSPEVTFRTNGTRCGRPQGVFRATRSSTARWLSAAQRQVSPDDRLLADPYYFGKNCTLRNRTDLLNHKIITKFGCHVGLPEGIRVNFD